MRRRHAFVHVCAMVAAAHGAAAGTGMTWFVDDDAPNDPGPQNPLIGDPGEDGSAAHPFDRIQEAINAAASGDAILVAAGTYFEFGTIDLGSKNLAITGTEGAAKTIIDMNNWNDQVMLITGGQNQTTIIEGMTLQNGRALGAAPDDRGAGLHIAGSPIIRNCVIRGNHAISGGGFYIETGESRIFDCVFEDNQADNGGAGFTISVTTISDCQFLNNMATNGGGAMRHFGTAEAVTRCMFSGNSALVGGAVEILGPSTGAPDYRDCTFVNNTSSQGGAVRINVFSSIPSQWINCVFTGNSATGDGGAVFIHEAVIFYINCTLTNNVAGSGGGAVHRGGLGAPQMQNCIAWGNMPVDFNSPMTVTYSNVQSAMPGTGNISVDPMFVDAAKGNLRLMAGSPCIDSGNSTALPLAVAGDYDGLPRVVTAMRSPTGLPAFGYYVDMGAFEFQAPSVDPSDPCPADTVTSATFAPPADGVVDAADLAFLLGAWGPCE